MDIIGARSGVSFGTPKEDLPDWRVDPNMVNETDPDDELLEKTPLDVIAILGFDPLDS